MLRLLHCADIHLDTPLTAEDLENADVRRAELRNAFSSMMLYVKQNGIRILLIAGDLFSHAFLTKETAAHIRREFASVPDCQIFIAPGNHDFYTPDCLYATASLSDNVHVFTSEKPQSFTVTVSDDTDTPVTAEIWGFANTAAVMNGYEPLAGLRIREKAHGTHRIFVGHAALSSSTGEDAPESDRAPVVTKEQLARAGFDYCALGHYHTSDGIRRVSASSAHGAPRITYYGYAGCLVGRGFSEPGLKGAITGTLGFDANGASVFSPRRLRITRRRYECLECSLDGMHAERVTESAVAAYLAQCVKDAVEQGVLTAPDRDTALRLTVTGTLPADLLLTEEAVLAALAPLASLSLIDHTVPSDISALAEDPTLRGAYYHALSDALSSKDPALHDAAVLALRLGLQEFKHK